MNTKSRFICLFDAETLTNTNDKLLHYAKTLFSEGLSPVEWQDIRVVVDARLSCSCKDCLAWLAGTIDKEDQIYSVTMPCIERIRRCETPSFIENHMYLTTWFVASYSWLLSSFDDL